MRGAMYDHWSVGVLKNRVQIGTKQQVVTEIQRFRWLQIVPTSGGDESVTASVTDPQLGLSPHLFLKIPEEGN